MKSYSQPKVEIHLISTEDLMSLSNGLLESNDNGIKDEKNWEGLL